MSVMCIFTGRDKTGDEDKVPGRGNRNHGPNGPPWKVHGRKDRWASYYQGSWNHHMITEDHLSAIPGTRTNLHPDPTPTPKPTTSRQDRARAQAPRHTKPQGYPFFIFLFRFFLSHLTTSASSERMPACVRAFPYLAMWEGRKEGDRAGMG
jgi:hypothetical protein